MAQKHRQITTVVFDFGGVIFCNPQHPDMSQQEHDEIWDAVASITDEFIVEHPGTPMQRGTFMQLFTERTPHVREHLRQRVMDSVTAPNQTVMQLIDTLRKEFTFYGLVNASYGWTELRRAMNNLDQHFTKIFPSHEINVRKPDPRIFQHFLHAVQIEPVRCLFIDDQLENIETARGLGFLVHHFQDPLRLQQTLAHLL